jgi:hypothetical protein
MLLVPALKLKHKLSMRPNTINDLFQLVSDIYIYIYIYIYMCVCVCVRACVHVKMDAKMTLDGETVQLDAY